MPVKPFYPPAMLWFRSRWWCVAVSSAVMMLLPLICCAAPAVAQEKAQEKKGHEEKKIPPPQEIPLQTGDGLQLAVTYFPGTEGKETVPVILLHQWKRSGADYKELAPYLQSLGHAVLVPDLRGHGGSTRIKIRGKDETLDAATMHSRHFARMIDQDLYALKEFLWKSNNAGELNIDKMCVVGAEMGASVALEFARYDAVGYQWNRVYYGPLKLGQFVKALVLISPEWSFRGLNLRRALAYPYVRSELSVLIAVGKGKPKALQDANRLYNVFRRYHPKPNPDDKAQQDLLFGRLDTRLQGTNMLGLKQINLEKYIARFIELRLVKSQEAQQFVWKERKFPHE